MIDQIKVVMARSETLAQDFIGASALVALLLAGLYLPF